MPASMRRGATLSRGRPASFVFHLHAKGPVQFVLLRCGLADKFTVRGHPGVNQIRFRGKVHGRRLAPGTYRVRARSRGKTVLRTRLVVSGAASPCGPVGGASNGAVSSGAGSALAAGSPRRPATGKAVTAQASPAPVGTHDRGGVLGARASKVIPGSGGTQVALLVVLLGAILLLALGALPRGVVPHPGAAAFVARRRAIFAAAGLAALAAFLVSYFIT
jgi:hypothetical protein